MNHSWSILCKKASIDSQTNMLSLFEIIEKLTITRNNSVEAPLEIPNEFTMPLDFQVATLITGITKKDRSPSIKIELFNSNNESMGDTENKLEIPDKAKSLRSIIAFNALKIKGEGLYTFKVSLKGNEKTKYEEVAKIPLDVEISKATV